MFCLCFRILTTWTVCIWSLAVLTSSASFDARNAGGSSKRISDDASNAVVQHGRRVKSAKTPNAPLTFSKDAVRERTKGLPESLSVDRRLLQTDVDTASGTQCTLTGRQVDRYLNVSTRTWLIGDDALEDLGDDLQAIVNCTNEGDVVMFDVSERIIPVARVVIPWNLTISGAVDDEESATGTFPSAAAKTAVACPEENEGIFLIRSKNVLLANLLVENCSFNASDRLSGIVEVESCNSREPLGTVRLHHVAFVNNIVVGGPLLLMNSPSCSALELIDVQFRSNGCRGPCGALLSSNTTLRDVAIEQNINVDGDDVPAIISAPEGSVTDARGMTARNNVGTVLFVRNGTLKLTGSSFVDNLANVLADDVFASCLHFVNATADIDDCQFSKNGGDKGGVVHAIQSSVDITDCKFDNNSAKEGAVVYSLEESQIAIGKSVFVGNVAEIDGGVLYANDSKVNIVDASFNRNAANVDGGCFWFARRGLLNVTGSNFTANVAKFGGVLRLEDRSEVVLQRCNFKGNKARTSGGGIYTQGSTLSILNCLVHDGNATFGGFFISFESVAKFDRFRCFDSSAKMGGCLYICRDSFVSVIDADIARNNASDKGGGIYIEGKAIAKIERSNITANSADGNGGGISTSNASRVTVSDIRFDENSGNYGGAVYLYLNKWKLTHCSFRGNEAKVGAGSLYVQDSEGDVEDCRFERGKAKYGGFVQSYTSTVSISNSSFDDGTTSERGGCIQCLSESNLKAKNVSFTSCVTSLSGGAIDLGNSTATVADGAFFFGEARDGSGIDSLGSRVSISDCLFRSGRGGRAGAVFAHDNGTMDIVNCRFSNNSAQFGGGLNLHDGAVGNAEDCLFANNSAGLHGGAVYLEDADGTFSSCTFQTNSAENGGSVTVTSGSRLKMEDSLCVESKAKIGGCIRCHSSTFESVNLTVRGNTARSNGGGIDASSQCTAVLTETACESNTASIDGGGINVVSSSLAADRLTVARNAAGNDGGGMYCLKVPSLLLNQSDFEGNVAGVDGGGLYVQEVALPRVIDSAFKNNSAGWGGAMLLVNASEVTMTGLKLIKNSAVNSGAVAFLRRSKVSIESSELTSNRAKCGASFYIIQNSSLNLKSTISRRGFSTCSGGTVYAIDDSTVRMESVTIERNTATEDGGAVFLDGSKMTAVGLSASHCMTDKNGGVVSVNKASTLLCIDCEFNNNTARRGGAISIEADPRQLIKSQFLRTSFFNNSAKFGGALHIVGPHQNGSCLEGANYTSVALSDVQLTKNTASYAGGAVFTTDLSAVRVDCLEPNTSEEITNFYTGNQLQSMNIVCSVDDLCSDWKGNTAGTYGNAIGTYAARVEASIERRKKASTNDQTDTHTIRNHASGTPLPVIRLEAVDSLGQGRAIGVKNESILAVMSSNGFLSGTIAKNLTNGVGTFAEIVGFQKPGVYDLLITFSEDALDPVNFKVEIRSCMVGETETSNRRFCQPCSAATYSFDPKGSTPCLPCPDNANCTSIVIRPEKGHWNRFPCSEHVQRCLTKRACDYEGRARALERINLLGENCSYSETTMGKYERALCREGHRGPLCGSCQENYGKSQSFACLRCFTGYGNAALVLFSVLVLMGLAAFATRSNLVSLTKTMSEMPNASGVAGPPGESLPPPEDLEMMERYYIGRSIDDRSRSGTGAVNVRQRAAKKSELARWKAVELFKIAVNFIQITSIAIAINVDWSLLLVGLFEAAEFLGGVTSEAANRSVDCLISEGSSVPRSVVSTVIDLYIPASVISVFVIFWSVITLRKKASFSYFLKRSVLSALAVFYISYISITKTVVNVLSCITVHDSTIVMVDHVSKYWAVDTSLKCYEGSHGALAGAVGWPLLIVFSLLFPIAVAVTIVYSVKEDYEDGWIYDVAGFMYRSYRREFVFWESIIMLRKAVLAVVVVFAYPLESSMQTVLAVFVLAVSLYLQNTCHPYRKEFEELNNIEGISLLVSLLTFVSSLCFDDDNVPYTARVVITVVVFICNTGLFFTLIAFFFDFSAAHLKAVLDTMHIPYRAEGGTLYILYVYFIFLAGRVLRGSGRCFKSITGSRFRGGDAY